MWGRLVFFEPNRPPLNVCRPLFYCGRRAQCEIVFEHDCVSGIHCGVWRDDRGRVFLDDFSTNGTYVNKVKLKKGRHHRLYNGCEVVVVEPAEDDPRRMGFTVEIFPYQAGTQPPTQTQTQPQTQISSQAQDQPQSQAQAQGQAGNQPPQTQPPIQGSPELLPQPQSALISLPPGQQVGGASNIQDHQGRESGAKQFRALVVPAPIPAALSSAPLAPVSSIAPAPTLASALTSALASPAMPSSPGEHSSQSKDHNQTNPDPNQSPDASNLSPSMRARKAKPSISIPDRQNQANPSNGCGLAEPIDIPKNPGVVSRLEVPRNSPPNQSPADPFGLRSARNSDNRDEEALVKRHSNSNNNNNGNGGRYGAGLVPNQSPPGPAPRSIFSPIPSPRRPPGFNILNSGAQSPVSQQGISSSSNNDGSFRSTSSNSAKDPPSNVGPWANHRRARSPTPTAERERRERMERLEHERIVKCAPPALTRNYDIGYTIGRGGHAIVKLCVDKTTEENYALKIVEKSLFASSCLNSNRNKNSKTLLEEVDIMRRLDHPNVVKIYDVFDTPDYLYLVLELVTGGDLFEQLEEGGNPYTEARARKIVQQILSVLSYLHKQNIAHRDLKPENILIANENDDIKLTDFGLSRVCEEADMKTVCGTPLYVAPEVLEGLTTPDHIGYGKSVDIWSLGVILYILLFGVHPFREDLPLPLATQITMGLYSFPSSPQITPAARHLLKRLLCVDPVTRITLSQLTRHQWIIHNDKVPEPSKGLAPKAQGSSQGGPLGTGGAGGPGGAQGSEDDDEPARVVLERPPASLQDECYGILGSAASGGLYTFHPPLLLGEDGKFSPRAVIGMSSGDADHLRSKNQNPSQNQNQNQNQNQGQNPNQHDNHQNGQNQKTHNIPPPELKRQRQRKAKDLAIRAATRTGAGTMDSDDTHFLDPNSPPFDTSLLLNVPVPLPRCAAQIGFSVARKWRKSKEPSSKSKKAVPGKEEPSGKNKVTKPGQGKEQLQKEKKKSSKKSNKKPSKGKRKDLRRPIASPLPFMPY